ncbi:MAG: DUF6179 domain-containing protein [Clostridiales bacterium]|jgi:hypothetical protein|nr:DUF6179 domain-containing protein [Clostridiales bacterium]
MNNIDRIRLISKESLSNQFYFNTLINEALSKEILSEADGERIQIESLDLLSRKINDFNGGESSSLPVEKAQDMLASTLYTIGIYLKTFDEPDDAANALKEMSIQELYSHGRKRIDMMLKDAKALMYSVQESKLSIDNIYYNAIIDVKPFFTTYNPEVNAHETSVQLTYSPCLLDTSLVGIEFIHMYLESLYCENMFCNNFSSDNVHHVLLGIDQDYKYLLINIFEFSISTAIGCILAGDNVYDLTLTRFGLDDIYDLFEDKDDGEINALISEAFEKLLKIFPPTNHVLEKYLRDSLWELSSRIIANFKSHHLDALIVPRSKDSSEKFEFTDAPRMQDASYRKLVSEVMLCANSIEKAALIKERVHSLSDLEDLMLDTEMSTDDLNTLYEQLLPIELAILAKRHQLLGAIADAENELEGLDENEQELRISLHLHIASLPRDKQHLISDTMEQMENSLLHIFDK